MTGFRGWLLSQRGREDAIGDVAERLGRDPDATAEDYDAIRQHLLDTRAEGREIDALDDAYAEFERSDDPPQPPPEPLSTH